MDYNYLIKHTETYENYKELLVKVNEILDKLENEREDFDKLVEYYYSDQFQKDYDDSNEGKIDSSINQGILTEDAIYDLMGDDYYLALRFLDLANKMIQNK
ncbi:DUF4298 domain-containing protein [Anaerococcus degeneri]|uniref:DUF4298 domain-containing protein n=1 Tax=Anaerococcus degeneri TaxID=361500 RepID=A0ABS7YYK7_9FIRM|nr:DUF4298 domain-containing protein [Anaerococcus degeneri]MBP2015081.1 hypothetical protein [Anaerococcus degeneri]MCA2095341.1 DUF4298 domain-containing protein [Anaerococcus degeneri]